MALFRVDGKIQFQSKDRDYRWSQDEYNLWTVLNTMYKSQYYVLHFGVRNHVLQEFLRCSKLIRRQFNYSLTLGYRPEIINLVSTAILDLAIFFYFLRIYFGELSIRYSCFKFHGNRKENKRLTFLPNKSNQIQHFCFVKGSFLSFPCYLKYSSWFVYLTFR